MKNLLVTAVLITGLFVSLTNVHASEKVEDFVSTLTKSDSEKISSALSVGLDNIVEGKPTDKKGAGLYIKMFPAYKSAEDFTCRTVILSKNGKYTSTDACEISNGKWLLLNN